jgi:prepilin-type N-terminal cleavage/methylation domain-containing protein/prepilin-type processing-associated H-X9-DG protein
LSGNLKRWKGVQNVKTNRQSQKKSGFTLIELLVVIAIISILAAILFPVFARARENARRASCMSNLKQIALGVFQYKQDYDEKLPLYLGATAAYPNSYGWPAYIQPYLKSTQIFQCPSEPNEVSLTNYNDYWINLLATGQSDAVFNAPASTVLFGDGQSSDRTGTGAWTVGGNATCVYAQTGALWNCTLAPITTLTPATLPTGGAHRHLSGANFAFADGHVKWEKGVSDTSNDMASVYEAGNTTETTGGAPTFSIK